MITANLKYNRKWPTWEAFRVLCLVPLLAEHMIKEQGYTDATPLKAYVNHGRWLVKCECGGCESAYEEGWFMCRSCLNGAHGHKYRPLVFPKQRVKIEETLLPRPLPNRNWTIETVTELRDENAKHKHELLGGA